MLARSVTVVYMVQSNTPLLTAVSGHFGTKTLRHQTTGAEVSEHFGTN